MVQYYKYNDTNISTSVNSEAVIVSLNKGMIVSINEMGTEIVSNLKEKDMTYTELCAKLLSDYDVQEEVLKNDVTEFLTLLLENNIIEEYDG
jgi:coenzyme PQQ synthesis protein D (PqqD)